ncbi:hypothetical protein [Vibrio parahaemolyticus]|uniref:hypothetical protein n=1 Tax=Vibrio parahaemolyticus TaxID=670 RepID=UPI00235F133D|nr:hypothetical protein [Vibrio parahaemolyticus]MDF4839925.1 hypothetical protein [Vibrio parahaemolyticus]MDG3424426.1 hypothetical protein [Vibrio parahaemolyticus]MDL2014150.1 hypothetical protein [Vibrio parahaemolyticus]HCG6791044.1 hypothetical protein [Vibrio parahaemolyticus]HCH3852771.1 hypothetical protein [Vibrio parahaemolyticus]
MATTIVAQQGTSLLTTDVTRFEEYLDKLGLPKDNIIAELPERKIIEQNLPAFIESLPLDVRREARYLSKFVAGAAIGLFDASLNYVWNEVVLNLRQKAIVYGLDMFFDAAVGGNRREFFSTEEDLSGIKDNTLINTCRKLELISDIVFTKLHHILTMRNDIGASHPNSYSINGFELMGWLQTCIKDVLNDKPSESAIQIKSFIDNLKVSTVVLDEATIKSMERPLADLSLQNTDNLLNSVFGIYVSDKTSNVVRKNIALFAPYIWSRSSDNFKYKLGVTLDGYKNNLYAEKHRLGLEFFHFCGGNRYQSLDSRIIALDGHADDLLEARYAWDNFYNEPPHMRKILSYLETENDIPVERASKIIKTILICRIGKGIPYNDGVSPSGKVLYDKFFSLLGDNYIIHTIISMHSNEVRVYLDNKICQKHMVDVLKILKLNARSERIQEIIEHLVSNSGLLHKIHNEKTYKDLTKNHIVWS